MPMSRAARRRGLVLSLAGLMSVAAALCAPAAAQRLTDRFPGPQAERRNALIGWHVDSMIPALRAAARRGGSMVWVLHKEGEPASERFLKDVLPCAILNRMSGMVVFAVSAVGRDAYQTGQFAPDMVFPHVLIGAAPHSPREVESLGDVAGYANAEALATAIARYLKIPIPTQPGPGEAAFDAPKSYGGAEPKGCAAQAPLRPLPPQPARPQPLNLAHVPWSSAKPSMPPPSQTDLPQGDAMRNALARSVYVLRAYESEQAFQSRGPHTLGAAVAVTRDRLLANCHLIEGKRFFVLSKAEHGAKRCRAAAIAADVPSDRCWLRALPAETSRGETTRGGADCWGDMTPVAGVRASSSIRPAERNFLVTIPFAIESVFLDGAVSSVRRQPTTMYVQTTAFIGPGASGGALFDTRGNLLGITMGGREEGQGLNFAIAADEFWREATPAAPGPTPDPRATRPR